MKKLFNYKYCFLIILLAMACTDDFEKMNTNPNEPEKVPTAYLLTQAQRGTLAQQQFFSTNLFAQLFAETQYTSTSRYVTEELTFDDYYAGPLADLQDIIRLNTNQDTKGSPEVVPFGANSNQLAVARILRAYIFQIITDQWGDVPYFEALKGPENYLPTYTSQAEIYVDLVKELEEASAQIDTDEPGVEGDVIYGGNMELWKKFANSLLLRVGMRMSEVSPQLAQQAINAAFTNDVFESNTDNAVFIYLTESANSNPIYSHFNVSNRTDYAISNVLVDFLKTRNDPRLEVYANPTENSVADGDPDYVGELYGVFDETAGGTTNESISFIGDFWQEHPDAPIAIMSYSEVMFIKAEAAQRGWISGNAETFYNEAIRASMSYYGITSDAIVNAYLAQASVKYNAAGWRKLIGEQKWASLYAVGHEPWSEWRRLGFPDLAPAPDAENDRGIPLRRTYDGREYALNTSNVNAAVARQAAESVLHMSDPVWWDK
jgi:hypothetical protein